MSGDYTQDRADAAATLAEDGQVVTITRRVSGTYNPATATATVGTNSDAAAAVLLPLSGFRKVDGTKIVAGDETLLLAALTTAGAELAEPKIDDILTLADGVSKYVIIAVDPLRPAGLNILFDCVVRGHA